MLMEPKLRFSAFTENYQIKTIKSFAAIKTGDKNTKDQSEFGGYPFYIRSDNIKKIDTYSYDGEAVLTSGDGVGVGKNFHYINGKFGCHQRVYYIHQFKSSIDRKVYCNRPNNRTACLVFSKIQ